MVKNSIRFELIGESSSCFLLTADACIIYDIQQELNALVRTGNKAKSLNSCSTPYMEVIPKGYRVNFAGYNKMMKAVAPYLK